MPKGGGRGNSSKKPQQTSIANAEESNVVFAHSEDSKKQDAHGDKNKTAKKGEKSAEEAAKRAETRTLIGGASWTGKLPVNLLSEHCQKQRWGKPEYITRNEAQGFSTMVVLRGTNPKTRDPMKLPPFKLPPAHQHLAVRPTAVESRHFAATYTLFRVCSMKNIHMMLPPVYKDLWKTEFEQLKKEDIEQRKSWMYESDPFAASIGQEEAQALAKKKREDLERQRALQKENPLVVLGNRTLHDGQNQSNTAKGWDRAPKADLGKRIRAQAEDLVREHAVWNVNGVKLSQTQREKVARELSKLGFRQSHIEEAMEQCKDHEEALEWLLIHVPEDDVPKWSLPDGYTAGLSLASGNIKRDATLKRLASAGFSVDLCSKCLADAQEDENVAAELLQCTLTSEPRQSTEYILGLRSEDAVGQKLWEEEGGTLKAILDDRFDRNHNDDTFEIRLQVPNQESTLALKVRRPASYPLRPPIIGIVSPEIPAYIRLSISRQAIKFAQDNLIGEPMVFNIVDWLEAEAQCIISNPGRLRDLTQIKSNEKPLASFVLNSSQPKKRDQKKIEVSNTLAKSMEILREWQSRQTSPPHIRMMAKRQSLPAWRLRDEIVRAVKDHQVTIISGETGSGKSTQSVQFILDAMIQENTGSAANIICTQPRRISALGLAERVSEERCCRVGDEVGYSIRGESRQQLGRTKIVFMTIGVLLRRLQTSGGRREDIITALTNVSHIFVDEVHERSLDTDFLLVILKDVLPVRKDLRIVLMSATLDSTLFEQYFGSSSSVGKVEIPGRTHPVTDYFLDDVIQMTEYKSISANRSDEACETPDHDSNLGNVIQQIGMKINYDLIRATVKAIDSQLQSRDGGILIFLPGTLEISRTIENLRTMPNLHVMPLHASLTPNEQRQVFPRAPAGQRKVIAATNVAETSITIEDIVAVIDCGRVKETSFDAQTNMVKLAETWASKAACKQRRGRAGRVQAGSCYKLYTRNAESKMVERPDPEIQRVPLEQLCLSVRAMGISDIRTFLADAITPPDAGAVEGAIQILNRMGAMEDNELTALGRHMSMIPADLRCGKLLVYGVTFGCLDAALTIAAILSSRSPFLSPQTKRDEAKAARTSFAPGQGDLICDLRAFESWSQVRQTSFTREVRIWCEQHFLSMQGLNEVSSTRAQLQSALAESGLIPISCLSSRGDTKSLTASTSDSLNIYSDNLALIRALISASFNPQVARISYPDKKFAASHTGAIELDPEAKTIKFFNEENGRVFIHPSSTLFDAQGFAGGPSAVFMSYFNKMATSKVFIRELTPFNVYTALMFGGPLTLDASGKGILIGDWLRVRGWARIGVLVGRLRGILDDILRRRIEHPGSWEYGGWEDEVIGVVRRLMEFDGMDC